MITVGAMFANSKWSDFLDSSILYYCLIRLIVFPAIVFGAVRLLGVDLVLGNVVVLDVYKRQEYYRNNTAYDLRLYKERSFSGTCG